MIANYRNSYRIAEESTQMQTRQLNYRKDDRAMRPIYECLKNFESPD